MLRPLIPHSKVMIWHRMRHNFLQAFLFNMLRSQNASTSVEVEKKFFFTNRSKIEQALDKLGVSLIGDVQNHDIYFDTLQYHLTSADYWLRTRNHVWELKYPTSNSGHYIGTATQYREENKETEILLLIKTLTGVDQSLSVMVNKGLLKSYADIKTQRRKYKLGEFTIDLDIVDFGYQLGEIELVVNDEKDIPEAGRRVEELANKLGVDTTDYISGKLVAYLWKYQPNLFEHLLKRGVVQPLNAPTDFMKQN